MRLLAEVVQRSHPRREWRAGVRLRAHIPDTCIKIRRVARARPPVQHTSSSRDLVILTRGSLQNMVASNNYMAHNRIDPIGTERQRLPGATPTEPITTEALLRDATDLHEALDSLIRVIQFRDRDRICCHGVSVTQCYALDVLVARGPCTLTDLAAELYLDKSTASRVIAALERKRYVRRSSHRDDGRAVLLHTTAAGRRLHERIRRELVAEQAVLLEDVSPAVRRAAIRLVRHLARSARSRACGEVVCSGA